MREKKTNFIKNNMGLKPKNLDRKLFCDIACSFNPCFIAYVAFAVGRCTETIKAVN